MAEDSEIDKERAGAEHLWISSPFWEKWRHGLQEEESNWLLMSKYFSGHWNVNVAKECFSDVMVGKRTFGKGANGGFCCNHHWFLFCSNSVRMARKEKVNTSDQSLLQVSSSQWIFKFKFKITCEFFSCTKTYTHCFWTSHFNSFVGNAYMYKGIHVCVCK